MQYIKRDFELVRGAKNIVSISNPNSILNWYTKVYNIFSLLDPHFSHIGKQSIIKLINNEEKTKKIFDIVSFPSSIPEYHLPGCYNSSNKKQLINIGFFQINDITISKPSSKELYSLFVYNYILYKIHSKQIKFNIDISQNIINYYTSMFMSLFGKQYGMIGIYTSKIPKLKFCIACYILASYFNVKGNNLFKLAQSYSTYNYDDDIELLKSYDFTKVSDFVKMISDLDVFSGFNVYKMMGRLYTSFGISFLTAFEDFGRFVAMASVCLISGNGIIPSFIYKYNSRSFDGILKITNMIYKK